ncbi:uncharacterized protein LOC118419676 [Branchiostoma floridae]|uniref:Uncharacterized protein LOC118419676 n=1 Tax=Branchiostoma floridae TaxID=7739 RepID=A0A9J7LHX6_BRAFL|nr:uncharacterized protein LOC118419676 [Branchiostoma floridae]
MKPLWAIILQILLKSDILLAVGTSETCGVSTFIHVPQSDCNGRDIAIHGGVSLQSCADACCEDPACLSFQYYNFPPICFLKNKLCSAEEKERLAFGNMYDRQVSASTPSRTTTRLTTNAVAAITISMATSTNSNGTSADQAGTMSGAIIGGAVAAGVVIFIIAVVAFIVYTKRRRPSERHIYDEPLDSQFDPAESPSHDTQGALLSDDGEYVDTLPSMVTLQEPAAGSGPADSSVSSRQFGISRGGYENIPRPPVPSSGHYQELQRNVYLSLRQF